MSFRTVVTLEPGRSARIYRHLRVVSASLCLLLACIGCRPSAPDKPGQTEYRVRDISFEGVEGVDEEELRAALATQVDRYNPFTPVRYLNTYSLATDIDRIEVFYRHHGFFDARVLSQEVDYNEDRERAKITYVVDEGMPTTVVSVRFVRFTEDGRAIEVRSTEVGGGGLREIGFDQLTRRLTLDENERFSRPHMLADAQKIRERLQENSYARARVEGRAYVDQATREATVFYVIDQGPACVWGSVYVDGNEKIPDEVVVEALEIKPNELQRYRHSYVEDTQRRLYDWSVFQSVQVETTVDREREREVDTEEESAPGGRPQVRLVTPRMAEATAELDRRLLNGEQFVESVYSGPDRDAFLHAALGGFDPGAVDVSDTSIDLYINVQEKPDSNYRFGVGLQIDSGRWETFLRANAVWRYIFRPLNRFEADLKLGYAWLPNPFASSSSDELQNDGVVVRGQLRYIRPQLLFGIFDLNTSIRASRDVELNYNVRTFGGDITFVHRPTDWFRYDFGYALDLVREESTVRDFTDSYRMGYLKVGTQFDFRDDLLQPTRGAYLGTEARFGEPLVGEFTFVSVTPDLRGYIPLGSRLTLGLRALAGWIFDFTQGDEFPQNYRYYGGGAIDFRGVPYRRLSPYSYTVRSDDVQLVGDPFFDSQAACEARLADVGLGDELRCEAEPTGGLFKAIFSVEPRFEIGEDWLFGAIFADVGTVQRDVNPTFTWGGENLHLAVGGGLRLATPVGPIRADIGYRITNSENFSDIREVTFYIAVGEAF